VPESVTDSGVPEALSAMASVAVRVPAAEGLNVILMAQLDPAPTELPQLLVWIKSPAFVPVTVIPLTLIAALPVLDRVTDFAPLLLETA
jgi:hypothetical protein